MKKAILALCLILTVPVFSRQNNGFTGSEIFFYNKDVGALIKSNHTILVTSNGAANWTASNLPENILPLKMLFVSSLDAWALSEESVFYSSDGGVTWAENKNFPSVQLKSIYFFNNTFGLVGGNSTDGKPNIFFTKDAGINWEKASFDVPDNSSIRSISFADETTGFSVSGSYVFKTTDGGANWKKVSFEILTGDGGIESCTAFDENNLLLTAWKPVVVTEGYLISSSDGGETWEENPNLFKWGLLDAYFFDMNNFWLSTIDGVFYSNDSGESWDTYSTKCDKFSFFEQEKAYGLFNGNLIYTEDGWNSFSVVDSTITSVEDDFSNPDGFKVYQNYPNPFGKSSVSGSQLTTIAFELPKAATVKINIYNSIGEIVKSVEEKKYSAGRHEFIFASENLTSGIYFYQIQSERFQNTKKFVFLR